MPEKKKNKRKTSFLSQLLLALNIAVVIALLFSYMASVVPPDRFWPLIFFGLAYPAILLLNLVFVVYWLLRLRFWFLLSLVAILAGVGQIQAYIKLSGNNDLTYNTEKLKVMTFNVRYFDRYNWVYDENERTRDEIFQLIRDEAPDIICFQEFYTDRTASFNIVNALTRNYGYPHYHTHYALVKSQNRSYGTATFSRFPVIARDVFQFTNNIHNFAIISDVVVDQDTFRVFNIHFESIRLSQEDRLFIKDLSQHFGDQEVVRSQYRQIFQKLRFASELRASQSREIQQLVEDSPYPVILCTDLNDTPSSYAYRQLTANLSDAFVESGAGLGNTYIGFLPAFRIDYILHDPFFESRAYRTINKKLSDHYPVVTYLTY